MRVKWLLIFLFIGCVDDEFPTGLYHYQVERLLSGGSEKIWVLASTAQDGISIQPTLCTDSIRLYITATELDSIHISRLIPNVDCLSFDTVNLGKANASGSLLFTDSINFSSGQTWIVQSIFSSSLTLRDTNAKTEDFTTN